MSVQIRGSSQIISGTVSADRLNLADTFDFTSGVVKVPTPVNSSDAVTKAYADSLVADGFQAGDGIDIDTATSPDTISVNLAATPALQFVSGGLSLLLADASLLIDGAGVKAKLKTEAGGSLSVDANGLYIADAAISNAKLANSAISGKSLGSNLDSLTAGATSAISMSSYNGSAPISDMDVKYDDITVGKNGSYQLFLKDGSVGSSKIIDGAVVSAKIASGAVGTTQLAGGAVSQAKLQNNSVGSAQIIDGSVAAAELAADAVETAKIKDAAVTTAKINDGAVVNSKVADFSITLQKASYSSYWDVLSPNGSTSAFDLSKTLQSACQQIFVIKNGLVMKQVASSPSGSDEYTVSLNGGTAGKGQITFGAAPANGEDLRVWFIANN